MRPAILVVVALWGCGSSGGKDLPPVASVDAGSNPSPEGSFGSHPGPDSGAGPADDGAVADSARPDLGQAVADTGTAVPPDARNVAADTGSVPADTGSVPADAGADLPSRSPITLQFAGAVATVAGTPLGLDSNARTAAVTGTLTYELTTPDSLPADLQRGRYLHGTTSAFTFTVLGHTIEGSTYAVVETLDFGPDTFRFADGPGLDPNPRIMKLDGMAAPMLKLWIAITDNTGALLKSDAMPDPFPTLDIGKTPHTFSIEDGGGTLLMQLTTLSQK